MYSEGADLYNFVVPIFRIYICVIKCLLSKCKSGVELVSG